jgi:hypothetical protein
MGHQCADSVEELVEAWVLTSAKGCVCGCGRPAALMLQCREREIAEIGAQHTPHPQPHTHASATSHSTAIENTATGISVCV